MDMFISKHQLPYQLAQRHGVIYLKASITLSTSMMAMEIFISKHQLLYQLAQQHGVIYLKTSITVTTPPRATLANLILAFSNSPLQSLLYPNSRIVKFLRQSQGCPSLQENLCFCALKRTLLE
jgi:hypothetical protein